MPPLLAPSEQLAGPPGHRQALQARLTALRADPSPGAAHTELSFITVADLITRPRAFLDATLLHVGVSLTRHRYAQFGLTRLLPPERTWIAITSADPVAFGGFHYPGQGYRHWQMTAMITRYGHLATPTPADPSLAALDLIRAYAHDSLHYGSYRRYQWHPGPAQITRTRYGINFRRPDGRTYSRPDPPGSTTTRNLGIITEAATDREACAIACLAADTARITEPATHPHQAAFRDTTGRLTTTSLTTAEAAAGPASLPAFLARMTRYHHTVTAPYTALLTELSPANPATLHTLIVTATITGSLSRLCSELNQQHGPAAFTRLFKDPQYTDHPLAGWRGHVHLGG